jgi:hypothetical protein
MRRRRNLSALGRGHLDKARALMDLQPKDLAMFSRLGITEDLLKEAQVERVSDADAREFGIKGNGDMQGIIFPYFMPANSNGQCMTVRLRRDHPEVEHDKPQKKYVSPYGNKKHLYFPPAVRESLVDPGVPIVFVGAEKSVLAGMAWAQRVNRAYLFIGTGGCWGWTGRIGQRENKNGPTSFHDDLSQRVHHFRSTSWLAALAEQQA